MRDDRHGPRRAGAVSPRHRAAAPADRQPSAQCVNLGVFGSGLPPGISSTASTAATRALTAAKVKPLVNPDWDPRVMPAAAMLETAATPIALPNSCAVLTMPDASPASWCPTLASAVVDAATKLAPTPAAATLIPATNGVVPLQKAGAAAPAAASSRPAVATGRGPRCPIAVPAEWAPAIVASAVGRNSSPVRNAPYPCRCWR